MSLRSSGVAVIALSFLYIRDRLIHRKTSIFKQYTIPAGIQAADHMSIGLDYTSASAPNLRTDCDPSSEIDARVVGQNRPFMRIGDRIDAHVDQPDA